MALADAVPYTVAAWTLDESSGTRVDSVGSNDLTDNNTVGVAAGMFGNAADFEKDNGEYLSIADNDVLSLGDRDFMFRLWLKAESLSDPYSTTVFAKINNYFNISQCGLEYDSVSGKLRWTVVSISNGAKSVLTSSVITTGAWYLVHCWHDATNNQVGIALNAGTAVTDSWSYGMHGGSDGPLQVGTNRQKIRYWDGQVDDLILLDGYILDAAERTADYNSGAGIAFADWLFQTVTTSIGQGTSHSESVDISSTSGSGPYTVTLASAVPAGVVIGDALYDEHATPRKYQITDISGSDLTVADSEGVGSAPDSSGTSSAVVTRYYNGSTPIADWAGDLDDSGLYAAGTDAVGQLYADADFTESFAISNGGTIGLNSITLTAGVGAAPKIVRSSGVSTWVTIDADVSLVVVEDFEMDGNEQAINNGISIGSTTPAECTIQRINLHGLAGTSTTRGISFAGNVIRNIQNNKVWDISSSNAFGAQVEGIYSVGGGSAPHYINNNTVDLCVNNNGTGVCYGIYAASLANTVKNNVVTRTGGTTSGTKADFNVAADDYCISSDSSAAGTHSITSGVATDLFVDPDGGDFSLKSGSDAFEAGTDLGTTPDGVNIDITGRDRDAEGDTWSIGSYQLEAAGAGTFTATASLTAGGASMSESASFDPGDVEATASLTAGGATLVATASFDAPVYDATADLTGPGATMEAVAAFAEGLFIATANLVSGGAQLDATASFDAGTFTGTADLVAAGATFDASATFESPTYDATADLTSGGAQFTATAAFATAIYSGTADLTAGGAVVSASATFDPGTFTATADLSTSGAEFDASATFDAPVYDATADLIASGAELTADASFAAQTFSATADLVAGGAVMSSTATFDIGDATPPAVPRVVYRPRQAARPVGYAPRIVIHTNPYRPSHPE